jgi:hypothetical protein
MHVVGKHVYVGNACTGLECRVGPGTACVSQKWTRRGHMRVYFGDQGWQLQFGQRVIVTYSRNTEVAFQDSGLKAEIKR